jgi:hypothetical protein
VFFLQTNGSGVLSFAGVSASAGQVIQVLGATDSTSRNTTSSTFVTASNTLSVTITPASASNKILILVSAGVYTSGHPAYYTIYRGSTNLGNTNGMFYLGTDITNGCCMSYLDSPSTTSATTYQVYLRAYSAIGTAELQNSTTKGSITCMEIKG